MNNKKIQELKTTNMGGLTDVAGILVGNAEDKSGRTGCTVILCPNGAVPGVSVVGGNPGTQQTDSIRPGSKEEPVKAILLTGGSNFGLAAASGVTRWLFDHGIDLVPIVPTAVIFDLVFAKGSMPPNADLGYAACQAANAGKIEEGNVGAGAGATIGKFYGRPMKGGLGTASLRIPNGPIVAALAVVNPLGDVWDQGNIIVGALRSNGTFVNQTRAMLDGVPSPLFNQTRNTTIAVIATTERLNKAEASRVATLAQDGMARAISPVHTQWDGDTVFCLALGSEPSKLTGDAAVTVVGTAAAIVLERAIIRGALSAQCVSYK
ncbi:L-aminopeptidase/D-esterase [Clostridium acidisoli DSM 12555]|uniref:L-aminopeptidase/D-esterase n=1 Tax=Clostridium acidisoli DSM 12555 TaxID=1121291 RepID=A0A1W1XIQ9_9CLOT|nr:P1 family peptidase [Clostridium acidisoli]SMC23388.1 L-aminopeptidase/D-esterase [Clostridium acidisoli DSM 12555]